MCGDSTPRWNRASSILRRFRPAISFGCDRGSWLAGVDDEVEDAERGHRLDEPFQSQLTCWFGFDEVLDLGEYSLVHHNLAAPSFIAESRGEVHHAAHRPVVVPPFEADPPESRVPQRDPDREIQLVSPLLPLGGQLGHHLTHRHGHPYR